MMKIKKIAYAFAAICTVVIVSVLVFYILGIVCIYNEQEVSLGELGFFEKWSVTQNVYSETPLKQLYDKISYRFFGTVSSERVSIGSGGFLFPKKSDTFDYQADISGKCRYSEKELEAIYNALCLRRDAYGTDGIEYALFVIPNSQTVLSEKLIPPVTPSETRCDVLSRYLEEKGYDNFYTLKSALDNAAYSPYNNTENTLNEYGAYLAYKEIISNLSDTVNKRLNEVFVPDEAITEAVSDGRGLSRLLGLEKTIKNVSYIYPTGNLTSAYDTLTSAEALSAYKLKAEYNPFIGTSSVMLDIPYLYEKALFKPLFASSYTNTVFKNSYSYSYLSVHMYTPDTVVQLIREDDLDALLSDADNVGYENRLNSLDGNSVTLTPAIMSKASMSKTEILIAGACEENAVLTVTVENQYSFTVTSRDRRFTALVTLPDGKGRVGISAVVSGKIPSETLYTNISIIGSSDCNVYTGKMSFLYYGKTTDDFTGKNLISDQRLIQASTKYNEIVKKLREATGKNTKIILLIAPNPLTIYPYIASETLAAQKAEVTRYDQLTELFKYNDDVIVLDVRNLMRDNEDIGKLYYQTDTHWTELGAYFGYYKIVAATGEIPHLLDDFNIERIEASAGDLAGFAGLSGFTEHIPDMKPLYTKKSDLSIDKPITIDRSVYAGVIETHVNDETLPSAIMIRDSYSANLFPWICEHFKTLYCQGMWDYGIDYKKAGEIKADYAILVFCERNFGSLIP